MSLKTPNLGNTGYYMKGEYGIAIKNHDVAISLDDNDAYAYYSRGLAYSSLGDATKARADFNEALELGHNRDEIEAALKDLDEDG
ncbi:MAG: tetratricopeptide repeat protein [Chloroflexi bacterium]|nr:tetratricopeptide repeat protein [Chloroflexota bacterium]